MGKAFLKIFLSNVLCFLYLIWQSYLDFAANSLFEPKSVMKKSENMVCLTSSSYSALIWTFRYCWNCTINRKASQFWLSTFSSWFIGCLKCTWTDCTPWTDLDLLVSFFCHLDLYSCPPAQHYSETSHPPAPSGQRLRSLKTCSCNFYKSWKKIT